MADHQPARLIAALLLALILIGCTEGPTPSATGTSFEGNPTHALHAWQRQQAAAAVREASALVNAGRTFVEKPTTAARDTWQSHWIKAHEQYLAATLLGDPATALHTSIDSWPLQPGFLDDLPGYPGSGIVNDITLEMTSTMLREQHQITDEEESSTGFHVLEYYAFERPLDSFLPSAEHVARRQQLVLLVSDLLLLDLMTYQNSIAGTPSDTAAFVSYPALLRDVHRRVRLLFSAYNRLGMHGGYAGRSAQQAAVQLRALRSLFEGPVALAGYVAFLDPDAGRALQQMMTEAIALVPESGRPADADASRLLLLLSGLSHAMDDLVRQLPDDGDDSLL